MQSLRKARQDARAKIELNRNGRADSSAEGAAVTGACACSGQPLTSQPNTQTSNAPTAHAIDQNRTLAPHSSATSPTFHL